MAIGKWISFGTSQPAPTPSSPALVPHSPLVSSADAKLFGLENFGNTCYANSVLQALYFCGPFRDLLLQYPDPSVPDLPPLPPIPPVPSPPPVQPSTRKRPGRNSVSEPSPFHLNVPPAIPIPPAPPTLLSALRSLFLHISRNPADKGTVAPRAFIDKLKEQNELFRGSMHQDAHEFLNYLLNNIMEDMEEDGRRLGLGPSANGGERSGEDLTTSIATLSTQPAASTSTAHATAYHSTIVHRLFEGVLTSETRCLTCETVSSRDESFIDLSIDIEQNSSVTACLRQFSASEMLCQKNKFFCDSCCDLQEAEKRMKIKKLPNILALHLKRFKYQEDVGKYIKLAYRVAFPFELRLFNTVDDAEDPDRLYELFAIVVHIGTGPHHGHYVTVIKARGVWTLFDDDNVSTVKESEIPKYFGESNSGSAYVLYYQAIDLDLSALGLKSATPPAASSTTTTTDFGSSITPGKPHSFTTGETHEQELSPGSPAPAMPPGLDEPDVSDKSDYSPIPVLPLTDPTPASTTSVSSPHDTYAHTPKPSPANPPNLSLHIPPAHVGAQAPPIPIPSSPPQLPHNHNYNHTFGSVLNKLRQSPSIRLRNGTSAQITNNSAADRRNGTDSSTSASASVLSSLPSLPSLPSSPSTRRPKTAQSTASTYESGSYSHQAHDNNNVHSLPSSPVPTPAQGYAFPNGSASPLKADKDKDKGGERMPEKKPGAWFRRKSARRDSASAPILPPSPSQSPSLSMPRLARRGSEAAISDASASSPVLPHSPLSLGAGPPLASGSRTDPVLTHARQIHKKSSPDLSSSRNSRSGKKEKEKEGSARNSGTGGGWSVRRRGKLPPRPATAGATMVSSRGGFGYGDGARDGNGNGNWNGNGNGPRPTSGVGMPPPLPPLPGSPVSPHTENGEELSKGKEKEKEREDGDGVGEHDHPDANRARAGADDRHRAESEAHAHAGTFQDENENGDEHGLDSLPPRISQSQSESQHPGGTPAHSYNSHTGALPRSQSNPHTHTQPSPQTQTQTTSPPPPPPLPSQSHTGTANLFLPPPAYTPPYPYLHHTGSGVRAGSVADMPVVPSSQSNNNSNSNNGSGSGSGSSSSSSAAVGNWKRATRKLSFTAPMLGFGIGRRDKERERERNKDMQQQQQPPSAFTR